MGASLAHARRRSLALWISALLSCLAAAGPAPAAEARVEVELIVPVVQRLTVEPAVIGGPLITSEDLARGHADLAEPVRIGVHSNVPWDLSIRLPAPGGPRLLWNTTGTRFLDLPEQWVGITSGRTWCSRTEVLLRLRLPLSWTTMQPGRYEPRVEYRLAPWAGE